MNYKDPTGRKSKAANETSWKATGAIIGAPIGKAATKVMNQAASAMTKAQQNGRAREKRAPGTLINNAVQKLSKASSDDAHSAFGSSLERKVRHLAEQSKKNFV